MRAKPGNLENLKKFFEKDEEFELTKEEYEKITGGILSKDLRYIKNKSKLSRFTNSQNFYLEIIPLEVKPMIIRFKKRK